jgi:hypothetical protein
VIPAIEAAKAVIFRRGPSQWVQLILWDIRTDTFTEGQWFKGRIYPERSDLSPDGSKLIYFAAKFSKYANSKWNVASYQPAWTAISKPPYLTALSLWNNPGGTYGGGGYFEDNHTLCLRTTNDPHKDHLPAPTLSINPDSCERHYPWLWRMERNGWEVISRAVRFVTSAADASGVTGYVNEPATIYHKFSSDRQYQLIMNFEGYHSRRYGDPGILTYSVVRMADEKEFLVSDTWADWDQQGRLVYAENGKLFAGVLGTDDLESRLIMDFNPNRPQLVKAPVWATTWN